MAVVDEQNPRNTKLSLSLDYRIITIVLLLVIAGMLMLWRPWNDSRADTRTIETTGQATVKAAPDEYVFYPSYEFKNADKAVALAEVTKKSSEIVAKLKELGVADSEIKTNSSGYDFPIYGQDVSTPTYALQITITVDNSELAQKVQDYLITTTPTGSVTPQATFSEAKRKTLESQARDEATKDARAKAEQSAENLGFRLGDVKTVSDGAGFGIMPYPAMGKAERDVAAPEQLQIQPGENELNYSVTVTYFVR